MIPAFEPTTGNLPPGEHPATWDEIVTRFGDTPWPVKLLEGLRAVWVALRVAGCKRGYFDGSFVSAKHEPGDFDGCWETEDVDFDLLDPVLVTFDRGRATQKAKFGGEFFLADAQADPLGHCSANFFKWTVMGIQRESLS